MRTSFFRRRASVRPPIRVHRAAHAHVAHDWKSTTERHTANEDVRLPPVRLRHGGDKLVHERVLAGMYRRFFPERAESALHGGTPAPQCVWPLARRALVPEAVENCTGALASRSRAVAPARRDG